MAKKKKITANPARGFATTSVASKPKLEKQQIDSNSRDPLSGNVSIAADIKLKLQNETPESATSEPKSKVAGGEADNGGNTGEKSLSELSPEELESRLEEAELQALVEKYSARSTRDASRHIAKLQTERRLLWKQGQGHRLFLRGVVGDEIVDEILKLAKTEVNDGHGATDWSLRSEKKKRELGEEETLVLLWTLHRALLSLGFEGARVNEALNYALKHLSNEENSASSIWGLEECLDWLTLNLEEDELPNLDLQDGKSSKSLLGTGTETPSASSEQSEAEDSEPTRNSSTNSDQQLVEPVKSVEGITSKEYEDDINDLESDPEPEELLSAYLNVKTRLYEIQPEVLEIKQGKGNPPRKTPVHPNTPKAAKLVTMLHKIESDVLFDKSAADHKWILMRNQLAQEMAERRNLGLPNSTEKSKQEVEELRLPSQDQSAATSPEGSDLEDDSDNVGAFGGLFASAGSDENEQNAAIGDEGGEVAVRDFGKSSGINPRRILEEACRARDSRSQLVYKTISRAAFANRQSLTIKWSKEQKTSFPIELQSVASTWDSDSFTFNMRNIATPDSRQSESYVSVVALFQIFSTSAKEEKVYLRLPATWRELWFEFVAKKKNEDDKIDRDTIRRIRDAYRIAADSHEKPRDQTVEARRVDGPPLRETALKNGAHETDDTVKDLNGQPIKDTWQAKVSAKSYQSMLPGRMQLPIFQFRDLALSAIEGHQVTIICGETGCGKSTQMPSFILEREMHQGKNCKIYCTEPRRISAITLAQRVSQELGEPKSDLGTTRSLVGYAIRLESQVSASTRLVYATTGIVLRMLESKDGLKEVTHVVIDEVHERSIETDFLLIILRNLIVKRPDMRIILMSATVDAERFSKYFNGAPILNVPGRTFPVETKFLEDAIELTGHVIEDVSHRGYEEEEKEEESITAEKNEEVERLSQYSQTTRQTLQSINEYRIDFGLIVELIQKLCSEPTYQQYNKAMLVFLPGIGEIRQLSDMIHATPLSKNCVIHALHSAIPSEDQQRAFQPPPRGMKKIVISTNIAETGVTIPDVTCVIDTGKHKEMRFDERRQISRLIESFISRANAKQRRGRAGRVQAGLCFHLFTKSRHDQSLAAEQTPEMLRLSLQDLVMRVKICKLGDIQTNLASALDPPSAKNIRRAIDALVDVGALTLKEDLTALGLQLSKLPLDPYLGKLVLHGAIFGSLDIAITIAAILTSKSPFVTPINGRQQAINARAAFAKGDSDLLTDFNAYASWRRICTNSPSAELSFCRKNLLSSQTLASIEDLKAQLVSNLSETDLVHLNSQERSFMSLVSNSGTRKRRFTTIPDAYSKHAENLELASAIIALSFYPKLLARDGKGWRNVATNQPVSLHPTSVLRTNPPPPTTKFLSFYSILQASSGQRNYNATALTPATPLFLALLTGDAGFHPLAHTLSLDGARVRFLVEDEGAGAAWKSFVALKFLRRRLEAFVALMFRGRAVASKAKAGRTVETEKQLEAWMQIWEKVLERWVGR